MREKREMNTYTESDVRNICLKLLKSFTNPEEIKPLENSLEEDFNLWFKQNNK